MSGTRSSDPKEILAGTNAFFRTEQSRDLRRSIAGKIEELGYYDIAAIDRVAAILMWGRSGSLLLASYLDGHEDVIMLPEDSSQLLFEFFDRFPSLSLRDKLLASPAFYPGYRRFFEGTFGISPAEYYAAVEAILAVYGKCAPEFLESRRTFFVLAHVAYNLALGRRPANPAPLIVYAQHVPDDLVARRLVKDFPQTKFIHTIRDPISSCDGVFHYHVGWLADSHLLLPYTALARLVDSDRPHTGMESRTRTIRFEDLHRDTAGTMRGLADWLGLPFRATLLDSTFNGIVYVVQRDGVSWSGPRLEQIQRRSRHLSRKDQAVLFAVFYENFVEWAYPCPRIFEHAFFRWIAFASLVLLPTKMELTGARLILKRRMLPSLYQGKILAAIKSLWAVGFCRLKIIQLLAYAFFERSSARTNLLKVNHKEPLERRGLARESLQQTP